MQVKFITILLIFAGSLLNVALWFTRVGDLEFLRKPAHGISAAALARMLRGTRITDNVVTSESSLKHVPSGITTELNYTADLKPPKGEIKHTGDSEPVASRGAETARADRNAAADVEGPNAAIAAASVCSWETAVGYLGGCADSCQILPSLDDAKMACLGHDSCGGITQAGPSNFQLRELADPEPSPSGERSFVKICPEPEPPALPEEWQVPASVREDPDSVGSYIDGEPTIFVNMAAFRDPLCHKAVQMALQRADHPRRLTFGLVEQNEPGSNDLPCDYTDKPCSEDPTQLLCVHADQIKVHRVDSRKATGPTFGRCRADRLYRGEYFALQVDGHTYFAKGWDTDIVSQWKSTRNEYAVLSTYPSNISILDAEGRVNRESSPVICDSRLFGNHRMLKHEAATEIYPRGDAPVLHPLWGAGLSFSRGHRILRVPYDCFLPMVFDGEEFSMGVRMWTNGYDFYTPHHSVLAHPYNRLKPPPSFFSNTGRNPRAGGRSARRILALIGLDPGGSYNDTLMHMGEKYGLGKARPLDIYMRLFGFEKLAEGHIRGNCRWAESQQLHADLVRYLRKDGKGIDYTLVPVDALNRARAPNEKKMR